MENGKEAISLLLCLPVKTYLIAFWGGEGRGLFFAPMVCEIVG